MDDCLFMGDRKRRRRCQHYLRDLEHGGFKTALSAASAATFQAIRGKGDHINDYARLLVTEELLLTDGSTFTWEYFQPVQLVQQVLDKCNGIARLYAEKLRDNPPSPDKPWRVVLGCDEHTPGNKVVSVNRRKNMALVFNFVELGPDILECDASWYVPVIGAILRQLLKFPMRWSSGADRDQPWLARSLPVDCRATDGTHRWGGHYEVLTVERPRKHEAMLWALQCFQERGAGWSMRRWDSWT